MHVTRDVTRDTQGTWIPCVLRSVNMLRVCAWMPIVKEHRVGAFTHLSTLLFAKRVRVSASPIYVMASDYSPGTANNPFSLILRRDKMRKYSMRDYSEEISIQFARGVRETTNNNELYSEAIKTWNPTQNRGIAVALCMWLHRGVQPHKLCSQTNRSRVVKTIMRACTGETVHPLYHRLHTPFLCERDASGFVQHSQECKQYRKIIVASCVFIKSRVNLHVWTCVYV